MRLVLKGDGRRTALWIAQTDELCEQAVQCFRQLWVNGQRRLRPRLPKQGVWQVERALDARYSGGWGESGRQGSCRFGFAPGQIQADTEVGPPENLFKSMPSGGTAFVPSGLALYWVVNGALSLAIQWWMIKQHGEHVSLTGKPT